MSNTENNTKIGIYLNEFNPGRLHYSFEKIGEYSSSKGGSQTKMYSSDKLTYIPSISNIRCPHCGRINEYNKNDIKYRSFTLNNQSKRMYKCKSCGKEIDIW